LVIFYTHSAFKKVAHCTINQNIVLKTKPEGIFKKRMEQFNGLSAKYSQQYLNWFAIKKQIEKAPTLLKSLIVTICDSYKLFFMGVK
jgi:hypothetical protein